MGFEVKIIADSISEAGKRLTTLTATYPRFVHCFDDATEVLCEIDGRRDFYPFAMLTKDHLVAAYHPQAGSIHFEKPVDVVHEHHDGEMVCLDSHAYLSFCVTPQHRMFVGSRKRWGDQWEVIRASELHGATQKRFRTAGVVCDGCYLGEPLSEFIGFFVGDGHLPKNGHQAMFNLKKDRKKEYVRELLDVLSVEYSCVTYEDGVTRFTFDRFPLLEACYAEDGQKRIPDEIMNATNSDMHAFMYGLWFSDGSIDNGEMKAFNTSSERVAKSLGAMAAMCGDSINIRGPYESGDRGLYKLTRVVNNEPVLRKDKAPVRNIQYSGSVHCATVSTGLLVVRHNGIAHISGNSEIMTHRDRERNAASSRAIPWRKMKEMIISEPVVPIRWGAEQRGMQAGDEIPERMHELADHLWLQARDWAVYYADLLHNIGKTFADRHPCLAQPGDEDVRIHKSLPNRLTEPWMWITVVMTATEWNNFFRLRCHPDAEIHFQKIANMIREAREKSEPELRQDGEWHLPFIQQDELDQASTDKDWEILKKASVARCARVSFLTHEGVRSIDKDLGTFETLANGSGFGHWSPHGHVAQALADGTARSGPFVGWGQYRKEFPNENLAG